MGLSRGLYSNSGLRRKDFRSSDYGKLFCALHLVPQYTHQNLYPRSKTEAAYQRWSMVSLIPRIGRPMHTVINIQEKPAIQAMLYMGVHKSCSETLNDHGRVVIGTERPHSCDNLPYEPLSKLLVSPLITIIVVPYIIPYITLFKEFRL